MDISEDKREETEDTRRKPWIMRKNEAHFAHATLNEDNDGYQYRGMWMIES